MRCLLIRRENMILLSLVCFLLLIRRRTIWKIFTSLSIIFSNFLTVIRIKDVSPIHRLLSDSLLIDGRFRKIMMMIVLSTATELESILCCLDRGQISLISVHETKDSVNLETVLSFLFVFFPFWDRSGTLHYNKIRSTCAKIPYPPSPPSRIMNNSKKPRICPLPPLQYGILFCPVSFSCYAATII